MTEEPGERRQMPIEWGKVREYAVATGSQHPDYLQNPEALGALAGLGEGGETDIRNILSAEQEYRLNGRESRHGGAGDQAGDPRPVGSALRGPEGVGNG
jgi:hypothetical protein